MVAPLKVKKSFDRPTKLPERNAGRKRGEQVETQYHAFDKSGLKQHADSPQSSKTDSHDVHREHLL